MSLTTALATLEAAQAQLDSAVAGMAAAVAATKPPTPSPNGATLTTIGPALIDGSGNVWTIVSGNRGSDVPPQQIALNGATQSNTGAVALLLYYGGLIYQENSAGSWWVWKGSAWASSSDPRHPPSPPSPPPSPPPPSPPGGYTNLAFFDDFTDPSTVTIGDTIAAGAKWCCPANSPTGSLQGGSSEIANSVLTIAGGRMIQSVNEDGTGGFSCGPGGYYAVARIALASNSPVTDNAWWMMSRVWLEAWSGKGSSQWPGAPDGFTHFGEIDMVETPYYMPVDYEAAVQDWFGIWTPSTNFQKASTNPAFSDVPTNFPGADKIPLPPGVDLTQFHDYGVVHTPLSASGPGFLQMYFDGQAVGEKITWTAEPPNPYNGTNPGTAPWTFAIFDIQDLLMFIGTGANGGEALRVDSVKVFT